ncbi:MAG TPA: SPOR domain-containing protein [Steroidobacteraceae bacterium]|nr:SPOR domain-containing protein [Steroidobacteraceae bacterium]
MEVRVRERLVGAFVLVALVVLLVPALLKGPQQPQGAVPVPQMKSVEVTLDDGRRPDADDALVPEPAPPAGATAPAATGDASERAATTAPRPAPAASDAPPGASEPVPANAPREAAEQPAWAVQLGAFSTREKAEGLVADLRRRGYAAFVLEYRAGGQLLHRVRVGPEQDRARAAAIAERLRKDGFQPVVAPHP